MQHSIRDCIDALSFVDIGGRNSKNVCHAARLKMCTCVISVGLVSGCDLWQSIRCHGALGGWHTLCAFKQVRQVLGETSLLLLLPLPAARPFSTPAALVVNTPVGLLAPADLR